jgi:L-asparagine transporter-like permease
VREPELARPFRMWGYQWTNIAVFVASTAFLVLSMVADPNDTVFTLVTIALSYPLYFFAVAKRKELRRKVVVIDPTDPS